MDIRPSKNKRRKPRCPICGGEIVYEKIGLTGSSGNDCSLFGGDYKKFGYHCKKPLEWCYVAESSFFIYSSNPDNDLKPLDSRAYDDWRELLERYHAYAWFAIDNNLKARVQGHFPDGNCVRNTGDCLENFLDKFRAT